MKLLYSLLALSLASSVSAKVPNLTDDNYNRLTKGKTVFIKFFAPWCGYCKAIAEDWEKLADEWAASDVGLVAEVDCTDESTQELCADIEGFPTLKYGDPSALDEYPGEREYADLSAFAKENLRPMCGLKSLHLCDDATKEEIEKYQSMTPNKLSALIGKVDRKIEELEEGAGDKVVELEAEINKIIEQYTVDTQKLKADSNYKYMIAVMRGTKGVDETLEDHEEL